jgi:glycosyltransferase involved in cell wall biosynthesis
MRTVLMLLENRPAPSDARVWPEALALRDAGFDVCVISPKGTAAHRESYASVDGVHIYRYSLRTGNSPPSYLVEYSIALIMSMWLSWKVWRRHRFVVIHSANPPDIFFPLAWLYRLFGVKFVYDQHDLSPETFESRFEGRMAAAVAAMFDRALRFCERRMYQVADLVIVTNESFRRIAMARGGVSANSVVVVRNGPDMTRLGPVSPAPAVRRPGWHYLLIYVGEMAAQDGVAYAIRALDILVHDRGRRDVGLALVGNGTEVPSLRILTRQLGLEEQVAFTGWVAAAEVPGYLSAADIGLSPEPRNAMNNASTMIKIMEYMAMGKPIVAFDLHETRFSAQDAALYAVPNSLADFASKIEELLDNDDLRQRMGELGRERVERELSWEHSRSELLKAYGKLFDANASDAAQIRLPTHRDENPPQILPAESHHSET